MAVWGQIDNDKRTHLRNIKDIQRISIMLFQMQKKVDELWKARCTRSPNFAEAKTSMPGRADRADPTA